MKAMMADTKIKRTLPGHARRFAADIIAGDVATAVHGNTTKGRIEWLRNNDIAWPNEPPIDAVLSHVSLLAEASASHAGETDGAISIQGLDIATEREAKRVSASDYTDQDTKNRLLTSSDEMLCLTRNGVVSPIFKLVTDAMSFSIDVVARERPTSMLLVPAAMFQSWCINDMLHAAKPGELSRRLHRADFMKSVASAMNDVLEARQFSTDAGANKDAAELWFRANRKEGMASFHRFFKIIECALAAVDNYGYPVHNATNSIDEVTAACATVCDIPKFRSTVEGCKESTWTTAAGIMFGFMAFTIAARELHEADTEEQREIAVSNHFARLAASGYYWRSFVNVFATPLVTAACKATSSPLWRGFAYSASGQPRRV